MSLLLGILASQGSGGSLLDSYGGAAAAYSLRKLSSTYGGPAIRVRRSLDNAEADIYFASGQLNQTELRNHVGYENIFTYSEQFENAAWIKNTSTVTPNAGTDPLGGNNAERWLSNVGSTTHYLGQSISLTNGQSYTVSFYVKSNTGSSQEFRLFGSSLYLSATNLTATASWQRFSFTFVADNTGGIIHGITRPSTNAAVDLLIFGAQLNQGVTAQPYQQTVATANTANGFVTTWYTQDSAVYDNLLQQSQTFENAYWNQVQTVVTSNATTAPDNTLTAEFLSETTVNGDRYIANTLGLSLSNDWFNFSCYAKANQRTWVRISIYNGTNSLNAWFDLQNGVLGTIQAGLTASIISVGNGWYRCSASRIMSSGASNFVGIGPTLSNDIISYTGIVGSGIYIWGAQLSRGTWLQPYQPTTTTAITRRNATQATAASQPAIVRSGNIVTENGKPAVYFNGTSGTELKTTYDVPIGASTFFATFKQYGLSTFSGIFAADNGGGGFVYIPPSTFGVIAMDGSGASNTRTAIIQNSLLSHYIASGLYTGSTTSGTSIYGNGNLVSSFSGTGVPRTLNPLSIGGRTGGSLPARVMIGTVQEGILYNSNMSSSITPLNLNQNSFYQVYWQGTQQALLDQFGGSAAAYSLRNLSSSYRGPLVRVRRSSDNAETDIGGTWNGDLDVNSLVAFTGGQNLLTNSEDFSAAAWTKYSSAVTSNVAIAPNGTLTADKLTELAVTADKAVAFRGLTGGLSTQTASVYLKASERNICTLTMYSDSPPVNWFTVTVNLITGEFVTGTNNGGVVYGASVVDSGSGWWRVSVTGVVNTSFSMAMQVTICTGTVNNPIFSYLGVAGSGVYIWGAQLNTGVLQPYIPTTTAAVNGANAFVTTWYDQSGNARNATQTTAASQPRIVNAGAVESEGDKPALFWTDGSGMRLTSSFSPIASPQSFFVVSKLAAVSGIAAAVLFDSYEPVQNVYYFTGTTEVPYNRFSYSLNGTTNIIAPDAPLATQGLTSIIRDSTAYIYDDSRLITSATAPSGTLSGLAIGNLRGNPNPIVSSGYDWFGSIQELTVYPTNQSSRTSVESNINSYYKIYWQGNGAALLDSYSGASAAYSLRNLRSGYTGPLVRIRRSNDNVETDIYGTFGGDLDVNALVSFVGANSAFVTTWYDQSGNNRHATQATAASQPRIVNAGVIDTLNGKPAVYLNNHRLVNTTNIINTTNPSLSAYSVLSIETSALTLYSSGASFNIGDVSSGSFYFPFRKNLSTDEIQYRAAGDNSRTYNTGVSFTASQQLMAHNDNGTSVTIHRNNTSILSDISTLGSFAGTGGFSLGYPSGSTQGRWLGRINECIIFDSDKSSSRVGISSNINSYYKIY